MIPNGANKQQPRGSESFGMNASEISNDTNPYTSNPMNERDLLQKQRDVIAKQDTMILEISRGVDVLHSQALEINSETKIQNQLLDKLDTNVDKAADLLRQEAQHAEKLRRTSKMCYMYILVILEIVTIIVLLIIAFKLV